MKRITIILLGLGLIMTALGHQAQAQATRTWISGVGDDANPCSRTAPCKTFAGAISKTTPGGEIDCLDPGGFGALTITKSITIDCGAGMVGSVLVSGTNGFNVAAAATDIVIIRNTEFQGISKSGNAGLSGINITSVGTLILDNVHIMNFANTGVNFLPTNAARLIVNNSTIENSAGGIGLNPGAGGSAVATIDNVRVHGAINGFGANSANGTVAAVLANSTLASSTGDGIVTAGGNVMLITVDRCDIVNSGATGISASGANVMVRVGGSTIAGNLTGVSVSGGATLQSFKNNQIAGNGIDGTPIAAFPGPNNSALQ